jgi:beta-xylosidase
VFGVFTGGSTGCILLDLEAKNYTIRAPREHHVNPHLSLSKANMPAPLLTDIYVADPSAHSFNGRIYVYPSHDRESDIQFNDRGDQYDMADYHVISMDKVGGEVIDHGVALKVEDVKWASKQLWAPDAAKGSDGKYYLYFPARNQEGRSIPALFLLG